MTQLSQAAQHRLIEIRYRSAAREAKEGRRGRRPKVCNLRLAEVERIYRDRFGKLFPNNPDGRAALQIVADCIALATGAVPSHIVGFIRARAPWALPEADAYAASACSESRWLSADEMAWRIGLSASERSRLKVRTIGAAGMTARQRKLAQKEKRRAREENRRREAGAKPRAASLSRLRPWETAGVSRAKWYRDRKRDETVSCPVSSFYVIGHETVSRKSACGLRDALRAGPSGLGPYGPRWSEQGESSVRYHDGRKGIAGEARP